MKKRQIRIEGDIAYVPLTKGFEAIIDASDAEEVGRWNWHAVPKGGVVYAARTLRNAKAGVKIPIYLHRWLLGDPPFVDHRDCNGLNNRRANLREATKADNQRNQRTPITNTSGLKGASWDNRRRNWRATIKAGDKQHHIGSFATKEEAHAAYCEAAKRLHGEFARVA